MGWEEVCSISILHFGKGVKATYGARANSTPPLGRYYPARLLHKGQGDNAERGINGERVSRAFFTFFISCVSPRYQVDMEIG